MEMDEEGFEYPEIDVQRCVRCGLCQKVCPVKNHITGHCVPQAAIGRIKDYTVRMQSTSGGVFSAICQYILEKGGVVYGAAFDQEFHVVHRCANGEDYVDFRGSKYVQSSLNTIFEEVQQNLLEDTWVCFSGTPCQVAGLRSFLGQQYEHLILVDFVCHGVMSPLLWEQYLEWMQKKNHSQIRKIFFRDKKFGYQNGCMYTEFGNGKRLWQSAQVNPALKAYFLNISLRPSCYQCGFKSEKHVSDITLFDCWYVQDFLDKKDDNQGYNSVLVQTEKGRMILEEIKDSVFIQNVELKSLLPVDGGNVLHSVKKPVQRNLFCKVYSTEGCERAFQIYLKIGVRAYLMEALKMLLAQLGLLKVISKIKRRMIRCIRGLVKGYHG
jgi:coenzyme F420-reducing hydrogenase beta subunit